jgi:RHS repeat-associated protein
VQFSFGYKDSLKPMKFTRFSDGRIFNLIYGSKYQTPDVMTGFGVGSFKIVSDHLGSVRQVINLSSGQIMQEMDYDEFGRVVKDTNPGFQPFGFAGGLYDSETGLTRFGARDYDAETGRWLSKDPIGFKGGDTNLYGYVANDPINFLDAEGLYKYTPTAGGPVDATTGNALQCFEDCVGKEITVTAGKEDGPHSPNGPHSSGQACDIGKNSNPDLDRNTAQRCFSKCFDPKTSYGQEEKDHYHFQTRPGKNGSTGGFPPGFR